MTSNDKSKNRKSAILSGVLALAIFASGCTNSPEDAVTVKIKEKDEDEDVKPTVEVEEESTWLQFDESVLMYKVDLDKFLTDKLKLSALTLENSDVINLIEMVRSELGEEFYVKDKTSTRIYNLDGKSVSISTNYGRGISVRFYGNKDPLEGNYLIYEIDVDRNGKTKVMSRSKEEGFLKFSKYYIIYNGNMEYTRSICIRENSEKYLSVGLHEGSGHSDPCSISFDTDMGKASIKLSKEEYDELHEIMLSYSDSDNLYEFLSDNLDLLNKYLDLVKVKNAEYYEDLCSLINGFIEKAKILRYE